MADDETLERINSLNTKQCEVFNIVLNWAKEYTKRKGVYVNPLHVFLSESVGTGKSHLVKTIYAVSKALLLI